MDKYTLESKSLEDLCDILSDTDIAYYLCKNPDFFRRHPGVLVHMDLAEETVSSETGNVLFLHKNIIERAREEIRSLQKAYHRIKWENEAGNLVQSRFQECYKELIYADSFRQLSSVVQKRLPWLLGVDFADILLESQGLVLQKKDKISPFFRTIAPEASQVFLDKKRHKLFYPVAPMPLLFRDQISVYNASMVVSLDNGVDFGEKGIKGMVVLASKNPEFFSNGWSSSAFVSMVDILAICLNKIMMSGSHYL